MECLTAVPGFGWLDRLKVCKKQCITFILPASPLHCLKLLFLPPNISVIQQGQLRQKKGALTASLYKATLTMSKMPHFKL